MATADTDPPAICDIGIFTTTQDLCGGMFPENQPWMKLSALTYKQQELLRLRTRNGLLTIDLPADENMVLCKAHFAHYLTQYERRQRACLDPLGRHFHKITKTLRAVTVNTYSVLERRLKHVINPGDKLCTNCYTYSEKTLAAPEQLPEPDGETNCTEQVDFARESLNTSLSGLDCSPFKNSAPMSKERYGKQKLEKTIEVLKSKMVAAQHTPIVTEVESDWANLIESIKKKIDVEGVSTNEKIKLLTLAPISWTYEKVMSVFGVSRRLVWRSKMLLSSQGILGVSPKKQGRPLSEDSVKKVLETYTDQELTRELAGERNTVSVRGDDGAKTYHQKHLILMNLRELHSEYQKKHPNNPVSLSKFISLRPKYCVTVDAKDTNNACVCTIHQNVELMAELIPGYTSYKLLLKRAVCDITNPLCMLHRCDDCPGAESLYTHLAETFEDNGYDLNDTIRYTAWVQTDRADIMTKEATIDDFCQLLSDKVNGLTAHHYIAKHQAHSLRSQKENLTEFEVIAAGDFAENYSFTVQDAIQGWHWVNSQATLHPWCLYYRDKETDTIKHYSLCMISNENKHDTNTVFAFQKVLTDFIKQTLPNITTVKYFTDGCTGQYKGLKNFCNIRHHKEDFDLKCEWNFFATSHGKGPCDGIGGVIKRLATRYSKQLVKSGKDRLLTALQLFQYAKENITGVNVFFVSTEEVMAVREALALRFALAKPVPGSRDHHYFVPLSTTLLSVHRLGPVKEIEDMFQGFTVGDQGIQLAEADVEDDLDVIVSIGQYCGVLYDNAWYIGIVVSYDEENNDYQIRFMRRNNVGSFAWPTHEDICWVPQQHILCSAEIPTTHSSGRTYVFPRETLQAIESCKFN